MRAFNLDLDLATGTSSIIGKDGSRHTLDEVEAAERAATRGDPAAAALLLNVDHSLDEHGARLTPDEVKARFEQLVHDCPECQAARARGEVPFDVTELSWPRPPTNSHARRRQRERERRRRRTPRFFA